MQNTDTQPQQQQHQAEDETVDDFGQTAPVTVPATATTAAAAAAAATDTEKSVCEISWSSTSGRVLVDAEQLERLYGDLSIKERAHRSEQERHWIAPSAEKGETYREYYSDPLPSPDKCIPIGTNGIMALAFMCPKNHNGSTVAAAAAAAVVDADADADDDTEKTKDKESSSEARAADGSVKVDTMVRLDETLRSKALENVAFAYKRDMADYERTCFFKACKAEIKDLCLRKDAERYLHELMLVARNDLMLRHPIQHLGKVLTRKIQTLPVKFKQGQKRPTGMAEERPGGAYATVEHCVHTDLFVDPPPVETNGDDDNGDDGTLFWLMACRVPHTEPKKKTKQPKWSPMRHVAIVTAARSVPAAAMNSTHVAVLYQPCIANTAADAANAAAAAANADCVFVRLYALDADHIRVTLVSVTCFRFPPQLSAANGPGMLRVYLSESNIFSVAFAAGAIVMRLGGASDQPQSVVSLTLKCDEHPRKATTARICDADERLLLLSTDKGECHGILWETGETAFIEHSHAVEPILTVLYRNHRLFMHTVSAVSGTFGLMAGSAASLTVLPLERPLGVDTCGGIIAVLSKYGGVKLLNAHVRQVARDFPPPPAKMNTLILQPAYDNCIRAATDHVVCLYPNGMVRTIYLATETAGK